MKDMLKNIAMQATDDVAAMYSQMLESPMIARVPEGHRETVASNLVLATLVRMSQIDSSIP
jgi:hypothetical protein